MTSLPDKTSWEETTERLTSVADNLLNVADIPSLNDKSTPQNAVLLCCG